MRVIATSTPRPPLVIEFDADDQDVLYCILRHVGGHPKGAPRIMVNQLLATLSSAGAREAIHVTGSLTVGFI